MAPQAPQALQRPGPVAVSRRPDFLHDIDMIKLGSNICEGFREMMTDVIAGGYSTAIEALQAFDNLQNTCQDIFASTDAPCSLTTVNVLGTIAVAGSFCVVQALHPAWLSAVVGKATFASQLIIMVNNISGVVGFILCQKLYVLYDANGIDNPIMARVTWNTIGFYAGVAAMMPLMEMTLSVPLARFCLYTDLVYLNMTCCALYRLLERHCERCTFIRQSCASVVVIDEDERTLVRHARISGSVACTSMMVWSLWWASVLHYKPLIY